jgi:hypothetical protein
MLEQAFAVANEPIILLTSNIVVERDEPMFGHLTKVDTGVCLYQYQYLVFYKTCVVYH